MQPAFWHNRWENDLIGFHQQQVNPYLQQHWPALGIAPGARVLVPLCGKSLDMAWLAAQGTRRAWGGVVRAGGEGLFFRA